MGEDNKTGEELESFAEKASNDLDGWSKLIREQSRKERIRMDELKKFCSDNGFEFAHSFGWLGIIKSELSEHRDIYALYYVPKPSRDDDILCVTFVEICVESSKFTFGRIIDLSNPRVLVEGNGKIRERIEKFIFAHETILGVFPVNENVQE